MDWRTFHLTKRLNLNPNSVEAVYALIADIDAVKNSWQTTERLLPQTIQRLTYSVIVTSTGASNRIEGNRLTDKEVEGLYKQLRIKKFRTRDEQEVAGYLEVLELILDNYNEIHISESTILQLHASMLAHSDKDARQRGHYKFGSNRVEAKDSNGMVVGIIFDPTPPFLVSKEMRELIEWYHWALENKIKHPLIIIANFIFEFLAIHPFQDGNGRTSRLLTNLMLLKNKYSFASVVSHDKIIEKNKIDYYLALNKTQQTWKTSTEDISAWLIFFLSSIKTLADYALEIMSSDTADSLLSANQMLFWQWALERNDALFSRKDAIIALGFPPRTVESIIKKLLNLQRLERIGEGRATRYKVIKPVR